LFSGPVADVEAAVAAAVIRIEGHGTLVRSDVISQLHEGMTDNLVSELRFMKRVEGGG
jgi:microcompartment protein CcmL/EutN